MADDQRAERSAGLTLEHDQRAGWSDLDFERELEPFAARLRMALAEAGYPHAPVYIEPTGVFIEDVPDEIAYKAVEVCGGV